MTDDYNIAVKGVDVDIDVGETVSPNLVWATKALNVGWHFDAATFASIVSISAASKTLCSGVPDFRPSLLGVYEQYRRRNHVN